MSSSRYVHKSRMYLFSKIDSKIHFNFRKIMFICCIMFDNQNRKIENRLNY